MLEKGISGGICHAIHRYAKAFKKYLKDQDKNKESSYLMYWNLNNLFGRALPRKLPLGSFNNEDIDKGILLKLIFHILNNSMKLTVIYNFYLKK